MVKAWDWQEATANTKDQDGDEHESKVTYAVVSDEQTGYEVNTLTGVVKVQPGDVLVQNPGDNAGRVDVVPKDTWNNNDYNTGSNSSSTPTSSRSSSSDSSSSGRR